ncbi:head fiber protein, partial [Herbiconiux daphne]
TLPTASSSRLGGIKVGANLTIASDGTLSATGGGGSSYVLPVATATTLGGVKQGANITIATDGTISTSAPDTSVFMRKDNTPDLQVSEAQTQFNDSVTFQDDINIAVSSTASVAPLVNFSKAQYVSVPSTPTSAAGTTADDNKAATKKYVDDAKSASASDATTKANAALTSANTHSDAQDVVTLQSAKDYTDTNKYTLTPATTTTLGGVKVGSGLSITSDGTLNASGGSGGGGDVTAA